MSRKDEEDCLNSKDKPKSAFGVPQKTMSNPVMMQRYPIQLALSSPGAPMARISTHTTTVPSSIPMARPISSPPRNPNQTCRGSNMLLKGNPTQPDEVNLQIVRRKNRMAPNLKTAHSISMRISELRGKYLEIYLSGEDSRKREFCSYLIAEDAPINSKYKHLDLETLLNQNLVQSRFSYLVQALGIQEKYASNLLRDVRPQFWRTVKFTSSLWKTYLESINGSIDNLMKMGYTKQLEDGLSFPDEVREPDIERVKEIAADLYLAKIETDDMIHDRHPYLIIVETRKDSSSALSEKKAIGQIGQEMSTREDSDSEYEDAKDGLDEDDNVSYQPPTAALKQDASSPAPECFVCGYKEVDYLCNDCTYHFCKDCDTRFHNRRDRVNHVRRRVGDEAPMATGATKRTGHEIIPATPREYVNVPQQKPLPTRHVDDIIDQFKRIMKRPVPKPRKRIPSKTSRVSSPKSPASANTPDPEELPPPIFPRTMQSPTCFDKNMTKMRPTFKGKVPQPRAQHIEREILRPPLVASYKPVERPLQVFLLPKKGENNYESLKGPEPAHIYETLDEQSIDPTPSPLPPKTCRSDTTTPVNVGPTTCPHCYCLNTPDLSNCQACETRLRKPSFEPKVPLRQEENRVIIDPWQKASQPEFEKPYGNIFHFPNATENPLYFSSAQHSTSTTEMRTPKPATTRGTDVTKSAGAQWECEFCTLLNPRDKKICEMCAKTKTEGARIVEQSPVPSAESPKFASPEPQLSYPSSLAVKLQEEEIKRNKEATRSASQSEVIHALQKREEEILLTKADDDKMPYDVRQIVRGSFSPTSSYPSYPSVFSSFSEGGNQEFIKSPKEIIASRRELSSYKEIREIREMGLEFVMNMKKAESLGFAPEELNIAFTLSVDDPLGPVHWLQTRWYDMIHQVMIKVTDRSKKEELGNISPEEARQALIERTGDVDRAVELSIEERKKALKIIMADSGLYPRTECLSALDRNDGDVSRSIQELQIMSFQPMLQRISTSCVEDDADGYDQWHQQRMPDRQLSSSSDELFVDVVSNKEFDRNRRIRMILAEMNMLSWGRAETAVRLIDTDFSVYDSIEAAQAVGDLERAKEFLQRECSLCCGTTSESHMVTMLNCQCRFCRVCVKEYMTLVIQEHNIMKLVCPDCGEPKNLDNDTVATEYFNNLDIMIRRIVDKPTHDLFQQKLRDRTLMREPNFRWCSHCSSGFINERPDVIKMACPHCRKYTCFECKKQWEDQHEGITCEQFAAWKEANDPEAQAHGLAAHLKQNGIECPNCKFRYDLAKGGCMHFKCNQCSHEFCSGCYQPFRQGVNCLVSENCGRRGLHAHHPRDCLFYLRDRDPKDLMKLLDDHHVQYDTEPRQGQGAGAVNQAYQEGEGEEAQGAAAAVAADVGRCRVMEQRETNNGLQDAECGRETPAGYAGLCRIHFTEYLVEKINTNLIDPLGIFDVQDLEVLIQRNDKQPPVRNRLEKDASFRDRLLQFVQTHLPLPKMSPRRRVLDMGGPVAVDQLHLIQHQEQHDGLAGNRPEVEDWYDEALDNDGFDADILIRSDDEFDDDNYDDHDDDDDE